jgi:hypothetical protein
MRNKKKESDKHIKNGDYLRTRRRKGKAREGDGGALANHHLKILSPQAERCLADQSSPSSNQSSFNQLSFMINQAN